MKRAIVKVNTPVAGIVGLGVLTGVVHKDSNGTRHNVLIWNSIRQRQASLWLHESSIHIVKELV